MRVAIIGYGDFGELLARLLPDSFDLLIVDINQNKTLPDNASYVDMATLSDADVICIATPYDSMESICDQLVHIVGRGSTILDVCSVKSKPAALLEKYFSGRCNFVATHPLFGPNSAPDREQVRDKQLIWCELNSSGDVSAARQLFEDLELEIISMTPDAHDREMAWIHALTFFVGRSLGDMKIPEFMLSTGYFDELLDLVRLDSAQSNDLFLTVEQHNPYAASMRERYIAQAVTIHKGLSAPDEV